jgi:hypothetical protein
MLNLLIRKTLGLRVQIVLLLWVPIVVLAQTRYPIDLQKAEAAFIEAREVSQKEGGRLWGKTLYGPMFFVDPATRAVVANEPDAQGVLRKDGNLYIGTLPASVVIADSPAEWGGKRWTMLTWYPWEGTLFRRAHFAHELFHRIQPELNLVAADTPSLHLDTLEGRIWLQLEWRALAAALSGTGPEQSQAIKDALAFRAHRRQLFTDSAKIENSQEVAEGVPEYTGLVAAAPDNDAARWHAIAKLISPDLSTTFVRSFAYTSGPAYGLLLDQRLPGWRSKVSARSDLGELLASTVDASTSSGDQRATRYGQSAIRVAEVDRAVRIDAEKARYRALLVEGPTLTVPRSKSSKFSFKPGALIGLDDVGTIYPTFHAVDSWGTLDVKEGALVPKDFSRVTIAAPTVSEGKHLEGPGWTLELASGWRLVPESRPGSYTVRQE